MSLNEKQRNCPYCHPHSIIKSLTSTPAWNSDELELGEVNSPTITVGDCWGDISFNPVCATLSSWGDGADPLMVDIKFCPFCGRSLN